MKDYKKYFNNAKIEMLFKQYNESYVIDLIKDKKSLFMFLYNLAQNKHAKFRPYLDNVLTKE